MNDPDRRHTSDGFDHDAIFADIVTHWGDEGAEPERAARPSGEDAATGDGGEEETTGNDAAGGDAVGGDADGGDADRGDADGSDEPRVGTHRSPINPPPVLPRPDPAQAVPAPQVWRAHEVDDEYEEHFEPPPVAPLPVGDLQFWAIIVGMGGGPLLLLYLVLFNRDASSYWMLTSIAMSVGGFALLVSRLPLNHEDDDDGARL